MISNQTFDSGTACLKSQLPRVVSGGLGWPQCWYHVLGPPLNNGVTLNTSLNFSGSQFFSWPKWGLGKKKKNTHKKTPAFIYPTGCFGRPKDVTAMKALCQLLGKLRDASHWGAVPHCPTLSPVPPPHPRNTSQHPINKFRNK